MHDPKRLLVERFTYGRVSRRRMWLSQGDDVPLSTCCLHPEKRLFRSFRIGNPEVTKRRANMSMDGTPMVVSRVSLSYYSAVPVKGIRDTTHGNRTRLHHKITSDTNVCCRCAASMKYKQARIDVVCLRTRAFEYIWTIMTS